MSLLLKFFLKSIKTDIKSELKYLFLSIIVLSFWFFVVSIPSITAFSEVGPYQVAQFDLFVTGPISEEFAKKLENSGNLVVKGKIIGGVEVCGQSGNCRKLDLFIVDNLTKALELTEINSAYLKESIGNGGAIIDVATAKKLNVELGSYVTIQVKNVTENVEITGILYPTSASRNRIVVDERAVKNIADMFRGYSSLWVKLSNKSDMGDVALIADESYFVAKRTEILDKKKAELDNLENATIMRTMRYGGFLVILAILLRDVQSTFNLRSGDFAVLIMMGASRNFVSLLFTALTVLRWLLIVLPVSYVVAKAYVENFVGLFMPLDASFIISVSLLAVFSVIVSYLASYWLFRNFDLARTLSEVR